MTTLDQLCITKACEFLLTPIPNMTLIEQYEGLKAGTHFNWYFRFDEDRITTKMAMGDNVKFNPLTMTDAVLYINELANKFREVYQSGVNQECTINLNTDAKKN